MAEASPSSLRRSLELLARSMRSSIGNLRAAAETLELYPGATPERRARLYAVLAEESQRLASQIEALEAFAARDALADPIASTWTLRRLLTELANAARATDLQCEVEDPMPVAAGETHLAPDAATLVAAASGLLSELRRDLAVTLCRLRGRVVDGYLLVDISWRPAAEDLLLLYGWRSAALEIAGPEAPAAPRSGLRGAARELDGEAWFNIDRDGGAARVRILLPVAEPAAVAVE